MSAKHWVEYRFWIIAWQCGLAIGQMVRGDLFWATVIMTIALATATYYSKVPAR